MWVANKMYCQLASQPTVTKYILLIDNIDA